MEMEFRDRQLKRVLWRCRRGTRELDLILTRFATQHYVSLSEQEKSNFEKLLAVQDPVLTDWLCHNVVPENQGAVEIVHRILSTYSD